MPKIPPLLISKIRSASRDLVRELGFMNQNLADTNLPPSAIHAIIEIGAVGRLSAKALSEMLLLEKSTVSRLVKSSVTKGEIVEIRSEDDARIKYLHLTSQGEKTLAAITRYAENKVISALDPLCENSRNAILKGLDSYSAALKASRVACQSIAPEHDLVIKTGYTAGIVGRIVEMHASYYSRLVGFGVTFESKVAADLTDFILRAESPLNEIWYVQKGEQVVGSIAIDGEDLGDGKAHLRWFIVDSTLHGTGVGKHLIGKAMAFCDSRRFREAQLWTFKGLDAARKLYERHGFLLVDEHPGDQWGAEVMEQKFVKLLD